MKILAPLGFMIAGAGLALWHVSATHPEAPRAAVQDFVNTGVPMIRGGSTVGGEIMLGGGELMNSLTQAAQNSGIGNMLTPTTQPGGGGVSPAADAPAPLQK